MEVKWKQITPYQYVANLIFSPSTTLEDISKIQLSNPEKDNQEFYWKINLTLSPNAVEHFTWTAYAMKYRKS